MAKETAKQLAHIKLMAKREITIGCDPEKEMTIYADSLNNLSGESPLPAFLFNECFDLHKLCWPDLHHPISLRQLVVSRVTNRSVIEKILKDDNPLLRKVCGYNELPVPDAQKSFYELFRLRCTELK
jgi:hypothetical protein